MELHEILRPAPLALLAGEERRSSTAPGEHVARGPLRQPQHPAPLAEHHDLAGLIQDELADQLAQLQELRA